MRERDITGVTRRKRRSLARPAKKAVPAHDLIGRDFTAAAPGQKLVGDITYIPTDEGWLYLATWLDLAPARSSATRWPTTTAHPWWSTTPVSRGRVRVPALPPGDRWEDCMSPCHRERWAGYGP